MKVCSFEGCGKKHLARGLCIGHYYQKQRGEELRPLQKQFHGLSEYDRFMARIQKREESGCWEWQGSRLPTGYGRWRNAADKIELASRAAWRLFKGPIPDGMFILHHCDNPACANPAHLFMGNQRDNMLDMWGKARARPGTSRGEKHGMSKITKEIVLAIRASDEQGTVLAARYGLAPATIGDIRKRRTWKHI